MTLDPAIQYGCQPPQHHIHSAFRVGRKEGRQWEFSVGNMFETNTPQQYTKQTSEYSQQLSRKHNNIKDTSKMVKTIINTTYRLLNTYIHTYIQQNYQTPHRLKIAKQCMQQS